MDKMKEINKKIYNSNWVKMKDQKIYGPAAKWHTGMIIEIILETIKFSEVKTVLDVGCGGGNVTHKLGCLFSAAKVKGIDLSSEGIKCAKRNYKKENIEYIFDEENDNLKKFKYDFISCFEVLEHVEEWEELLTEISKSAQRYIMLSFPTGRMRSFESNKGHVRNFKKGEVESFLEMKGFYPIEIYYAGFPFYSPVYRELCNIFNVGSDDFSLGKYTWKQKIIAGVFYFFFRFLSTKRRFGDKFIGLFERR